MLPNHALTFGLCLIAASAGGCAQGQFVAHASINWPGATQAQMDDVIAKPVGQHLFGSTNGIVSVTSFSTSGKVDLYAVSDGLTKPTQFLAAVNGSLEDSAGILPRGASVQPLELLPKDAQVPQPAVHPVDQLQIDPDRAKLIDAGLSQDDIHTAVTKVRNATDTGRSDDQIAACLIATTLPAREGKPVKLGDVASVQVIRVPDTIGRHWP